MAEEYISAGQILIMSKGDWNNIEQYKILNMVRHGGKTYLAKKTSVGIEPGTDNEEYWFMFLDPTEMIKDKADGTGIKFIVENGKPYMEYDTDIPDTATQDIVNYIFDDDPSNDVTGDSESQVMMSNILDDDPSNDAPADADIDGIIQEIFK